MTDQKVLDAVKEYIALRDRKSHPDGTFDSGGRFYLTEKHECCRGIRTPSRAFPYSEMTHGRTLKHVAMCHGVNESECRKVLKTTIL